jgi:hypothetical protein
MSNSGPPETSCSIPAVRIIGGVATGDEETTDQLITYNAIPLLGLLLGTRLNILQLNLMLSSSVLHRYRSQQ